MAHKMGTFSMPLAAYHEVFMAGLRLVCDTPEACLQYYLEHSLRATAGMAAAYVN